MDPFFIKSTKIGIFYRYGSSEITTFWDPCSSFKVDAILNENAQDGEEEENLFQSYPATLLDEGGEEEADEGQQEVDIFHKSQQLKEWMLLKISQVDAVQGETAHVTFVDYGNSTYCEVHKLQPNDAMIGEDGQLWENLPATNWISSVNFR